MKKELFLYSLTLHNAIARKYGMKIGIEKTNDNTMMQKRMAYDEVSQSNYEKFVSYKDYNRYRTLELIAEEVHKNIDEETLKKLCVAEAGVFRGDFAWIIERVFPESRLYLYDTFEGFDEKDMQSEIKENFTNQEYLEYLQKAFSFKNVGGGNNAIKLVQEKLIHPDRCVYRKGYFPQTVKEDKELRYVFVSLDMDLYKPMYEGIMFFYPRLINGGYMFVHDYNNKEFNGVRKALEEAERYLGVIAKVPLADEGGTVVLIKEKN